MKTPKAAARSIGQSTLLLVGYLLLLFFAPATNSFAQVTDLSREENWINRTAYQDFVDGNLREQIGDYEGAAESYLRALKRMPYSNEIRIALSEILYQLQRYAYCIEALRAMEPPIPRGVELLGMAYRASGQDDSAKSTFRQLIAVDPDNSTGYSFLASYFRAAGKKDSTIWAYSELARIHADNYRLPYELGRLYVENGQPEKGKEAFRKSLALVDDITNLPAWTNLAELYASQDSLFLAREMYLHALEADSTDIISHRDLSEIYIRLDSLPEAAAHARRASELSPLDRRLSRQLVAIYFGLDSLGLADSVLNALLGSGERTPFEYYYLGRIATVREQYPVAIEHFKQVANMTEEVPQSWIDLASVYRLMNQPDQEIETYQLGLSHMRRDSSATRLLFALGAAQERNGQIDRATATFEELIAKSPTNAQALNYLGYMLADRNQRLDYARDLIERAVKLSPDNGAFLDSYGWVQYRLGKYSDAIKHLKKASELETDPVIFDHLGDVYLATGNKDEARRWWKKALELDPDNQTILEKLSQ